MGKLPSWSFLDRKEVKIIHKKYERMFEKCLLFFVKGGKMVSMERNLTADQEKAKNLIKEWYYNSDDQFFVLSGYAGTGKTFLLD